MSDAILLNVIVKDVENSESIQNSITEKAQKLKTYFEKIQYCKVILQSIQKHKHQGKLFRTTIELGLPRKRLIVNHKANEDILISIRDAFRAMEQQLEKYVQKRRQQTKAHTLPLQGEVVRLFENYGFIETVDGNEYYFHESHVLNPNFSSLSVGKRVEFTESMASDGFQANQVKQVDQETH